MKHMQLRGTVILLCLALSTSLFASGVDLTGIGARAQALGGNYRALSNDWSGMFWNPGGIMQKSGLSFGASIELVKPIVGYTAAVGPLGMPFSATSTTEIKNNAKTFVLPAFGVMYNTGKITYGLGFWAPFGLGAEWDLLNTAAYNANFPEIDWEDDLKVIDIHPTIAVELSDKVTAGIGLSIIYADIMIRKPKFTNNPFVHDPKLAGLKAALPPALVKNPYDQILTDTKLEGDGLGFGANFGILYKATETLNIGVSAQYYGDVPLEGTIDAMTYFANAPTVIPAIKPTLDALLAGGLIKPADYQQLLAIYSGQSVAQASGKKINATLPLPVKAGIGVAYSGISNLIVTADVGWTNWAVWDVIEIKDENDQLYSQLDQKWQNSLRFGVGLEYALNPVTIRGSFYTENNAAVPETMAPTIPDAGRRNVVIIGVGVPVGPLELHASFEKMFISDMNVTDWNLLYENMAGLYKMDVTNFMFGVSVNL